MVYRRDQSTKQTVTENNYESEKNDTSQHTASETRYKTPTDILAVPKP